MRSLRLLRFILATIGIIIIVGAVSFYVYWQNKYPYGWSHCCDKGLYFLLVRYADEHGGKFPSGETSPEASLSLLHRAYPEDVGANLLRGKTVPEITVQQILDRGDLLGPETCGCR